MYTQGIDCSSDNQGLDVTRLAPSVEFVMIRAGKMGGIGFSHVVADTHWPTFLAQAEASNRLVGAYAYVIPQGAAPPAAQAWGADHAYQLLEILYEADFWATIVPRLPVMLDLETLGSAGAQNITHYAQAFLTTIAQGQPLTAPPPLLYTYLNFWQAYLAPMASWKRPPAIAIAAYQPTPPTSPDWTVWQYTDAAGPALGFSGPLDGDFWHGDRASLEAYCRQNLSAKAGESL